MENKTSYKVILKATGILGGVQVIDILIRIAQMKIVAILLGPAGVGIIGLYKTTIDLIRSATGFGLDFSSVRDIAKADGCGNIEQIYITTITLRRWVWFTGLVGMLVTILLSKPLSVYAFGDEQYSWSISILSIVLLLSAISGGQLALLQGLRKISLMARAKIWGIIVGFFITVPLYWFLGLDAILPVIIITAVVILFYSWFYSSKIYIEPVKLSLNETFKHGLGMARLGFFMVISTLITMASMYMLRAFVANKIGIDGVGQFQAAWTISSLYLTAVLQAMGTDYFPRLSAVSDNNKKVVSLVNEQTEIALLFSGPVVVGMLSFAGLVVFILYSSKFDNAILILHWMLAGTFLKVISWPLGFIILAKGRGGVFIITEVLGNAVLILAMFTMWDSYKLEAAGISYLLMYLVYTLMVYFIAKRLCGFSWSNKSIKLIFLYASLIYFSFVNVIYNQGMLLYIFGGLISIFAFTYSLYEFNKIVDLKFYYYKYLKGR